MTLAMMGQLNVLSGMQKAAQNGLDWDVAQYPSYPEKPNTYGNASVYTANITAQSKNKEQAFRVLEVLVSDEFQTARAKTGSVTVLKNPAVKQAFGADMDFLKDKHVEGIFKSLPVKYPIASEYRSKAEAIVKAKFSAYAADQIDVNTALRQAEEEINQMIATEKSK